MLNLSSLSSISFFSVFTRDIFSDIQILLPHTVGMHHYRLCVLIFLIRFPRTRGDGRRDVDSMGWGK